MAWNRSISKNEQLMISVLETAGQSLNMSEIVKAIAKKDKSALSGKTPEKSLYSIIYRREKRRKEQGKPPLFLVIKRGGTQYYQLNKEAK